ncbi:MAG: hypothetical protein ACRC0L_06830 [Angustibacter sp.]
MTQAAQPGHSDAVVRAIDKLLRAKGAPKRFSLEAAEELLAVEDAYTVQLATEAVRLASRGGVDDVARIHVREARDALRGGRREVPWLEILGALFGAAFLQQIVTTAGKNEVSHGDIWWLLGFGVPTMVFFVAAAGRRW